MLKKVFLTFPQRLIEHPEAGRRLVWMGWAREDQLEWVYANAAAVAVPSRSEGFGLPVVEALVRGTPALASDAGSLREVGADATWRLPVEDHAAWADAVRALATDESVQRAWRERAATFEPRSWAECAADLAAIVARA